MKELIMAFKDLFTKKNTANNPASSCCHVEIVPDVQSEQAETVRDITAEARKADNTKTTE